jgi:hypothetical protein
VRGNSRFRDLLFLAVAVPTWIGAVGYLPTSAARLDSAAIGRLLGSGQQYQIDIKMARPKKFMDEWPITKLVLRNGE